MHDVEMLVDKVCAALKSLNTGSAVGPDKVRPLVLKSCASQLAALLHLIFNM